MSSPYFALALTLFVQATASAPMELPPSAHTEGPIIRVRVGQVVHRLPLESYLMGVIPSEMPPSWPLESLKAQVVASRSFVLSLLSERQQKEFDVDSTVNDQVFNFKYVNYTGPYKERVLRAIRETQGEVLVEPRGSFKSIKIQRAYFHADCGGSTETSYFVWRTEEPLVRVKDRGCPLPRSSKWQTVLQYSELEEALGISGLKNVVTATQTPSGRNDLLVIEKRDGSHDIVLAEVFRRQIGYNRVKSAMFSIHCDNRKSQCELDGQGLGHGVGMCQWGARWLAEKGQSYKKILKHYYPLSKLDNIREHKETMLARIPMSL